MVSLAGSCATCAFAKQERWRGYVDELEVLDKDEVQEFIMIRSEGHFQRGDVIGQIDATFDARTQVHRIQCINREGRIMWFDRAADEEVSLVLMVPYCVYLISS